MEDIINEEHVTDDEIDGMPQCCICHEKIKISEIHVLSPCFHIFHKECIERWLVVGRDCGMCRRSAQESPDSWTLSKCFEFLIRKVWPVLLPDYVDAFDESEPIDIRLSAELVDNSDPVCNPDRVTCKVLAEGLRRFDSSATIEYFRLTTKRELNDASLAAATVNQVCLKSLAQFLNKFDITSTDVTRHVPASLPNPAGPANDTAVSSNNPAVSVDNPTVPAEDPSVPADNPECRPEFQFITTQSRDLSLTYLKPTYSTEAFSFSIPDTAEYINEYTEMEAIFDQMNISSKIESNTEHDSLGALNSSSSIGLDSLGTVPDSIDTVHDSSNTLLKSLNTEDESLSDGVHDSSNAVHDSRNVVGDEIPLELFSRPFHLPIIRRTVTNLSKANNLVKVPSRCPLSDVILLSCDKSQFHVVKDEFGNVRSYFRAKPVEFRVIRGHVLYAASADNFFLEASDGSSDISFSAERVKISSWEMVA